MTLTNSTLGAPRANRTLSLDTLSINQLSTALKFVYSNESLAVRNLTIIGDYNLTNRDAVVLVNAGAGNVNVTLAAANSWGSQKTPIIIIKRLDATVNTVTVFALGSDLIDGVGSVVVAASGSTLLVSDSTANWYTL